MHKNLSFLFLALVAPSFVMGNIFGPDKRLVWKEVSPWSALGKVELFSKNQELLETCSGSLLTRKLVLTAAHCVGRSKETLHPEFFTYFQTESSSRVKAVKGWFGEWQKDEDSRKGDWALLLLEAEIEAIPFNLSSIEPYAGLRIAQIGFAADLESGKRPSGELNCEIRAIMPDKVFHHDCATYAGSSGGPILVKEGESYKIIGVHNAHKSQGSKGLRLPKYERTYANLAVHLKEIQTAYQQALALHLPRGIQGESRIN